jgi:pilus assembly protein CpaC
MFVQSRPAFARLLFVILAIAAVTRQAAAEDEASPLPVDNDPLVHVTEPQSDVRLVEKFAKIIELKNRITTVYGFDPEVVNVTKVDMHPNEIRVHALTPGVTSLVLVDEKNTSFTLEVFVIGDVRHLQAYIKNLFPNDAVTAVAVRESVVLRGYVSVPENIPRIIDIAKEFYPNVINQMEVGGDQEIQLKVRVIEIDRTKLRELGFNFLGMTNNAFMASTPGSLAPLSTLATPIASAPGLAVDPTKFAASPSFLGGVVNNNHSFSMFLDALEQESLLKILANPVLTTTNGQPANMLSGGEFPILVPQSLGTVTVQWKEFGVRLMAVPLLLGNGRVRLNLQPEVSQKDLSNSVTTGGLTVPGLTTRRVNTSVEMRFGETFMLAGLIEVQDTAQTFKVPWLGELPWLGSLFRRVSYQSVETELVILVTPVLAGAMTECQVPPGGPGMFSDQPTDRELYSYGMIEVPSYGDHCNNCGNGNGGYPPPIIDFDMSHGSSGPMYTPTPIQDVPGGVPQGVPGRGTMPPMPPASSTLVLPPHAPPTEIGAPPAASGTNPQSDSSTSYSPGQSIRQVSAQSPAGGADLTNQAGYNTPVAAWPGSNARPSQQLANPTSQLSPTSSRGAGQYEPPSGLYVPAATSP